MMIDIIMSIPYLPLDTPDLVLLLIEPIERLFDIDRQFSINMLGRYLSIVFNEPIPPACCQQIMTWLTE